MALGNLFIRLGIDTADFQKRFSKLAKDVEKRTKGLAGAIGRGFRAVGPAVLAGATGLFTSATAAAGAFVAHVIHTVIPTMDQLVKSADRMGLAVDSLAALRVAAEKVGVEASVLDKGFTKLISRIQRAAAGNNEFSKSFAAIGLDVQKLIRLAPEEQFLAFTDVIKRLPGPAAKVGAVFRLMEEEGVRLTNLFAQGSDEIRKQISQYKLLAGAIDNIDARKFEIANLALIDMRIAIEGVKREAALELLPLIAATAGAMQKAAQEGQNWGNAIGEAIIKIVVVFEKVRAVLSVLGNSFESMLQYMTGLASRFAAFMGQTAEDIVNAFVGGFNDISAAMLKLVRQARNLLPENVRDFIPEPQPFELVPVDFQEKIKRAEAHATAFLQRAHELAEIAAKSWGEIFGPTPSEQGMRDWLARMDELAKARDEFAKEVQLFSPEELEAYIQAMQDAAKGADKNTEATKRWEEAQRRLAERYKDFSRLTKSQLDQVQRTVMEIIQGSEGGLGSRLSNIFKPWGDSAKAAADVTSRAFEDAERDQRGFGSRLRQALSNIFRPLGASAKDAAGVANDAFGEVEMGGEELSRAMREQEGFGIRFPAPDLSGLDAAQREAARLDSRDWFAGAREGAKQAGEEVKSFTVNIGQALQQAQDLPSAALFPAGPVDTALGGIKDYIASVGQLGGAVDDLPQIDLGLDGENFEQMQAGLGGLTASANSFEGSLEGIADTSDDVRLHILSFTRITEEGLNDIEDAARDLMRTNKERFQQEIAGWLALYETRRISEEQLKKLVEQSKEDNLELGENFNLMISGMTDAFDQFIRTGEFNFKSMVDSILADMARLAFNETLKALFAQTASAFGGTGFNWGSVVGAFFGGFTPKAHGGPVQAGGTFMVGEEGPELFIPKRSGTIIPNDALMASKSTSSGFTYEQTINLSPGVSHEELARILPALKKNTIDSVAEMIARGGKPARAFVY